MRKIHVIIILLIFLLPLQLKAEDFMRPSFLPNYFTPAFEINRKKLMLVNQSFKDGADQYLYFNDDKSIVLLIENIKCDGPRSKAILDNILGNLNDRMKNNEGEFIEINKNEIHARIYEEGMKRTIFVYKVPTSVQIWNYVMKSEEKYDIESQFKIIRNFVNKQRYEQALPEGNISMGAWGPEIYDYAKELLQDGNKKEGLKVLQDIISTSPYNFNAHVDFIENTDNSKSAENSAKTIMKNAEDVMLVAKAAKFLNKKFMKFKSIPFLSEKEKGLQVIIIPVEPCDVSFLEEVSQTYKTMTNIPVKIRRIKEKISWNNIPDRIPYQRTVQELLVKLKGEDINFENWAKEKYIDELKKSVESKSALDKYYIKDLISKIDKEVGQYAVKAYLDRFLDIIEKYRGNDIRTMYVGVTGMNIYDGDNNYVFSLYKKDNKSRASASILSYYMMMAKNLSEEYESRKRLTDRIAKELVPASLKSLDIPRSTDPTCPYSYSSGVQRLDQKTLILSDNVKNEIEKARLEKMNYKTIKGRDSIDWFEAGNKASNAKRWKEAINAFEKAIELNQKCAEAYYNLGFVYLTLDDINQSILDFNQALKLNPKIAEAYSNRGIAYSRLGKHDQAFDDFDKAIELNPKSAEAYRNRGIAYGRLGNNNQAIADSDKAIELKPNWADAYNDRGIAYYKLGHFNEAIADYDKVIEINPKLTEVYSNRGNAYSKLGNSDQAIADYNKAIELNPKNKDAYVNRGNMYSELGNHNQAIIDFNKTIELDSKFEKAYYGRGAAYSKFGKHNQAIMDFSKAVELDPKYSEAYRSRGIIYSRIGNNNQAIVDYNKAIELDPKYAGAYSSRGLVYYYLGKHDQALADYDKAIALDPKSATAYSNRGIVYGTLGNHNQAIADFDKVIELNPKAPFAYYNRGIAFDKLGKNEQAISDFKKAASLGSKGAQDYLAKKGISW